MDKGTQLTSSSKSVKAQLLWLPLFDYTFHLYFIVVLRQGLVWSMMALNSPGSQGQPWPSDLANPASIALLSSFSVGGVGTWSLEGSFATWTLLPMHHLQCVPMSFSVFQHHFQEAEALWFQHTQTSRSYCHTAKYVFLSGLVTSFCEWPLNLSVNIFGSSVFCLVTCMPE